MKDSIQLYYREGSSDKVYKANIKEEPTGFIVQFAYGRRGSSLTTGNKTPTPVSYDQAKKIYTKLIQEKTAKGYQEDPNGKPFSGTVTEVRDTGVRPQLLNEITEEEVDKYLTDDNWCAQEKHDGRRRMLIMKNGEVTGTNRKGLSVPVDSLLEDEVKSMHTNGILDGEDMGDHIVIFDILSLTKPYAARFGELMKIYDHDFKTIKLIHTAFSTEKKKALYKKLQKDNAEGIVFKNINAPFTPGRPNSGGDQLKFKFCATATCVVSKTNPTKRSVSVAVYDTDGNKVEVGNVTVYPNQQIPQAGTIIEVRYLYAYPDGALFQPVLLGSREDMDIEDCTHSQLKMKRQDSLI